MLCRNIIFFSCILVAAATGGNNSEQHSTTELATAEPGESAGCGQQEGRQPSVATAAAAAMLGLRSPSCGRLRDHLLSVAGTQGWDDAVSAQPEELLTVSRLLTDNSTSELTAGDTAGSAGSGSQPLGDQRHHRLTPTTAATPTSLSDGDVICLLRTLSPEEKGRRLIVAAKEGDGVEVRLLLAAGADVGARDQEATTDSDQKYRTALHWAADGGHTQVVGLLLRAGASVRARDNWQRTPLHLAAWKGHLAVVRLLLAASADPNVKNEFHWTPLLYAARYNHTEVVTALLKAGANKEAKLSVNKTALDLAKQNHNNQLVDILNSS